MEFQQFSSVFVELEDSSSGFALYRRNFERIRQFRVFTCGIVGDSPAIETLLNEIAVASGCDLTVLFQEAAVCHNDLTRVLKVLSKRY
jgi:hypothetical protein